MDQQEIPEEQNPASEREEDDIDTGPIKPPTREGEEPRDPNEGEMTGAAE
jgi:hypothetical protein